MAKRETLDIPNSVADAKLFSTFATDEQLLAAFAEIEAAQRSMSLSKLTASCRVSDCLWKEARRRGLPV